MKHTFLLGALLLVGALSVVVLFVRGADTGASSTTVPSPTAVAVPVADDIVTPAIEPPARSASEVVETHAPAPASPTPPPGPHGYVKPPPSIGALADAIRDDIRSLKEHLLFVTADRIVRKSTYLREDVLNKSYAEPFPEGLDIHDFHATYSGPNGTRIYTFKRDEYPLYAWFLVSGNSKTEYGARVDDELFDRVLTFAEESLRMVD